jgi:hypothetical protein
MLTFKKGGIMKKINNAIIVLSVLAVFSGCSKEQFGTPDNSSTGRAGIELTLSARQETSKASVNPENSKVILWTKGDRLSVFDADRKNCEFTLDEADAGKSSGKFSGTVTKTSTSGYTALYPYQSGASYDGAGISGVVLKSEQKAVKGSFDPEAALMCGQSTAAGGDLVFRNIAGFIKFTTDFECEKVSLVSNNTSDKIAGAATVTVGDTPAVSVTGVASNEISLVAESGTIEAGTYYFAVLPGTLSNGFRLVFTMTDGTQRYKSTVSSLDIKSNDVKNIKTTISTSALKTDLSAPGTANCYLVKEAGNYAFKTVQGNTSASVGSVSSVEVLWESYGSTVAPSVGDIISSAKLNGEYIEFSTPSKFNNGNAVIAAKDANGTILWSWHIWCASEGWNEQVYNNNAGTMMDRNLGATTATAGHVRSLGLLYQWGRKDPFQNSAVPSTRESSRTTSASTNSSSWSTSSSNATQDLARTNPMTLYTGGNGMPNGSWASTKTAYDPCPAGWRVPDGGMSGIWAKAADQTGSIKISRSSDNGLDFSRTFGSGSTTIWYPAVGFYNDNGDLYGTGLYGDYWSVTPSGDNYAYFLDLSIEGAVNLTTTHHRKWGQGVRCMKI